jgi:hypothetical protein
MKIMNSKIVHILPRCTFLAGRRYAKTFKIIINFLTHHLYWFISGHGCTDEQSSVLKIPPSKLHEFWGCDVFLHWQGRSTEKMDSTVVGEIVKKVVGFMLDKNINGVHSKFRKRTTVSREKRK